VIKTLLLGVIHGAIRVAFGLYQTPRLLGQCIVVSNHNSMLDAYVLSLLFPLRALSHVRAAAAADTFGPGVLGRISRVTLNPILVERRVHSRDPLTNVRAALGRGDSLIIFPEGTRGEPGVIQPFKPGIGELARSFPDIRIYPCFIAGIERVLPRHAWLPLPFNVEVLVGEPRMGNPHEHRRQFAKQIEEDVRMLSARYERARRL
jgi:1-acyl-sn-glycerol-3-phosphate acyltransferase